MQKARFLMTMHVTKVLESSRRQFMHLFSAKFYFLKWSFENRSSNLHRKDLSIFVVYFHIFLTFESETD